VSANERSGWRDQELSKRHREFWGKNCPACDLDFLMVEYNHAVPIALVEYKHYRARPVNLGEATYRALVALAAKAELPFLLAFYWPETWCFYIYPVNERARAVYDTPDRCRLSEHRYVKSLHFMRDEAIEQHILARLECTPLPSDAVIPVVVSP
jgi:hypothetical protein